MLVVKIELHSAITGQVTEIGKMIIANDGTGTREVGNYDVRLGRRGVQELSKIYHKPSRRGRVLEYRRLSKSVWELVSKALKSVGF